MLWENPIPGMKTTGNRCLQVICRTMNNNNNMNIKIRIYIHILQNLRGYNRMN